MALFVNVVHGHKLWFKCEEVEFAFVYFGEAARSVVRSLFLYVTHKINHFTHDTVELIQAIVARHRINEERTPCTLVNASGKLHLIGMQKICINSFTEVAEDLEGVYFH